MSNDETGKTEGQGLPGYSANNTIPGGFSLPIPTAANRVEEQPASDPWSSTWEDESWQSEEAAASGTSSSGQWADSYGTPQTSEPNGSDTSYASDYSSDYSSTYPAAYSDRSDSAAATGDAGSTSYGSGESTDYGTDYTGEYNAEYESAYTTNGHATDQNGWDTSSWSIDDGGDSSVGTASGGTDHWQTLQHNADVASASQEEYSGWEPAGSVAGPEHYASDHSAALAAYEAAPAIDPDVAEAATELGYEPEQFAPTAHAGSEERPSADDLITVRSKGERQKVKASRGLRKAFGLGPSVKELIEQNRIDRIARPLNGRKTIMVINTKGGGGKTLVTLMLASYLGRYRSGSVLAWDNNETEGTLGMRAPSQSHHRTVVDLLGALPQIAADPNAGTSELEHWVREQRGLSFDVLASADDDEAMRIVGEQEFEDLHTQLSRFYRMIIVDTGNNRLAPNWLAAAARADLLVFATSLKDDTSVVAAKNLDALVSMGRGDLVRNAVCVISHTSAKGTDIGAGVHTREHFEQWVRAVVDIPYDPMLAPGLHLDPTKIGKKTHDSCMEMAAVVVDGL
jgi:MinD-like ATPase involved in chromosome partitioning or flagellar assembly